MSSRNLKSEAEDIIRELDLLAILAKHGDARVVGSVALDLVVKLDIDLHLVVSAHDLFSVADAVYHALLDHYGIQHVRISDYRKNGGLKVGIDSYPGPSGNWSIDIWITDRSQTAGFELVDTLSRELTPDQRDSILRIKQDLHARGELQDGLSTQIYKAVVDNGVSSVEGFQKFLSRQE